VGTVTSRRKMPGLGIRGTRTGLSLFILKVLNSVWYMRERRKPRKGPKSWPDKQKNRERAT
jgi:hypothetical protein